MKRVAFVLLALTAVLMIGAAGAYFTAQAQVPENVIKAGTVAVSTEPTTSALSIDSLAPGSVVNRPLSVLNDGSLPVSVIVTGAKKAGITEFYDALRVSVTSSGTPLYNGPLAAMRTTPFTLAPGSRAEVDFGVSLPATATSSLAGDYAKLTLCVDAEQAH